MWYSILYYLENKLGLKSYCNYERMEYNEFGHPVGSCSGTEIYGKLTGTQY